MAERLRVCLLGPVEVRVDGEVVALPGATLHALLVRLALTPDRVVPVPELIDLLWADDPPADAIGNLQRVWTARAYLDNDAPVLSLAYSPDGATLATGHNDRTIRLWDVTGARPLGEPLADHQQLVTSLAFSPRGDVLAAVDRDGAAVVHDLASPALPGRSFGTSVLAVAFSPDGARLATGGSGGDVQVWDVATGQQVGPPLAAPSGRVHQLAWSPDGRGFGVVTTDGQRGRAVPCVQPDGHVPRLRGRRPDGDRVEPGGRRAGPALPGARRRGARRGIPARRPGDRVRRLRWQPRALAARGPARHPDHQQRAGPAQHRLQRRPHPPRVRLRQREPARVGPARHGTPDSGAAGRSDAARGPCPRDPRGQPGRGAGGVRRRPGHVRAVGSPRTPRYRGADALPGDRRRSVHPLRVPRDRTGAGVVPDDVREAALQPRRLAAGQDVATSRQRGAPLAGPTLLVESLAFAPNGATPATGLADGTVLLWDVEARRPVGAPLRGHSSSVVNLAFGRDATKLASGGSDGSVLLWDVAAEQLLGEPVTWHNTRVQALVFAPGGTRMATGSSDGTAYWDVDPSSWASTACAITNRNLTQAEWTQLFGSRPYEPTCAGS